MQAAGMRWADCIRVSAQSVPPELSLRLQAMGEDGDSGAASTRFSQCFASAWQAQILSASSRCQQQAFAAASAQSCYLVDAGKF